MKTADIFIAILFILLILISTFSFIAGGDEVMIDTDGGKYIYPLSEERTVSVNGPLGETTIEIKDGDVRIIDSPCPNKTCLSMRLASNSICCLPNHVLITIINQKDEVDSYAY